MSDCQFVIDACGLDIWQSTRKEARRVLRLDRDDAEAPARLGHWLKNRRARCTLIADLAEERHVIEQLPRTSRADRRALIRRRLAQHYPDIPFTCARPLPRESQRQPMLLAALTKPSLLDPWLGALGTATAHGDITVRALTSVPFLLERWYRRQRALPAQGLLLTLGAGGMRQILFRERRLHFARVIPARAATLDECLPRYAAELDQTLAWLASQRLTSGPPAIRILAPQDALPSLNQLAASMSADIAAIDIDAGAQSPSGENNAKDITPLVLREARSGGNFARYACPSLQPPGAIAVRRGMIGATALLAVSALAASAQDIGAIARMYQESERIAATQRALQDELAQLTARLPPDALAPAPDPDTLAHWLDAAERLTRNSGIAPAPVLHAIAGLMNDAPWAEPETLGWRLNTPDDADAGQPGNAGVVELVLTASAAAPTLRQGFAQLESAWRQNHDQPARIEFDPASARLSFSAPVPLDISSLRSKP